jgi:uncharacterized protein involved in exopolysaccharide biosynthesis
MGKHKNRFEFRSTDFITFAWSNRKLLISVIVSAIFLSAIISFFITPKYQSSVVMFPASSASVSKTLLTTNSGSREDILKFGGEEEGEQLMQILYSTEIRSEIIKKFNLAHHYKIDTTSRYWRTNLNSEYKSNITFHRTEYMSVIIDVLDANPDTAAFIANEISNQIDSVMTKIQHDRAKKAFEIVEKEYLLLEKQITQMEDSLRQLQSFGIIDYKSQAKAYNTAYAKAIENGNTKGAQLLEKKLNLIAKYGGTYLAISDLLKNETLRLSALKSKYVEAKVDVEQTIPHKFIVDKAYRAEKKTTPKRLIIVMVSAFSAFFMALILLVLFENIKFKSKD